MQDYHLKISLNCMYIFGVFPYNFRNELCSTIYHIYSFIIRSYFVTFVIFEYIELVTVFNENLYEDIAIMSISLLYTTTIWKIIVCNSDNFHKLIKQIRETETRIFSYSNENLKYIYNYYVKWNHKVDIYFLCVTVITLIPFYIGPILEQTSVESVYVDHTQNNKTVTYQIRSFPANSWLPFNKYDYYYIAYTYYVAALTIGGGTTVATDILFVSMMVFGIAQIKILSPIQF